MNNYTIVSDPGVDDLVALVLLYKLNPSLQNSLISTFGNASQQITAQNAKEFISFVAQSWCYLDGAKIPINGKVERPWPDYFHGPDGVWGVHPKVNTKTISCAKSLPHQSVISLATLTEPLNLIREQRVEKITLMGGAFVVGGNETEFAETNIAFDPDAASSFFKESKKIKVKVVPLDVTQKVFWSKQKIQGIPENNEVNLWLKKLLLTWFDKYNHEREKDFVLHDPLAVYLDFYPRAAYWKTGEVKVIVKGSKRGQTLLDGANHSCEVALSLVNPTEIADLIFEKVFYS
jgi:purine nucleosidase